MTTQISSPLRNVRTLFFRVDTSGSGTMTVGGADGLLTRNGAGDVTIVYTSPFAVLVGVQVCVGSDSTANEYVGNFVIANTDASQVRAIVNDDAGTAVDSTAVFIEVSGIDDPG